MINNINIIIIIRQIKIVILIGSRGPEPIKENKISEIMENHQKLAARLGIFVYNTFS